MKNKKITRKISQGVYVLTNKDSGCIVDAVSQVSSSDNPLISVAVMKKNYTNITMHNNKTFALSVLGKNVDPNIIETFGYHSSKDYDKYSKVEIEIIENEKIIKDSLGYMICEIVDEIDTDTHHLFIGKLIHADVFKDEEVLTYGYYQEHKDDYIKVVTKENKIAWVCTVCGYVEYLEILPDDYKCPVCGVDKTYFKKQ